MHKVAQKKTKTHAPKLKLVAREEDPDEHERAALRLKGAQRALEHHLDDIHGAIATVEDGIEDALAAVSLAQEIEEADEAELRSQCGRALAALAHAHRHTRLVKTYLADSHGDS
jgi:hypothetical protein